MYGIYKNARNVAWQCLIDFKVASLPVDLFKITQQAGTKAIKNSKAHLLLDSENGASIYQDGKWYLIYDDYSPIGRRRFTIAHELGHIFLGHELINGRHGRTFKIDKPQSEREADMFAAHLLAPACVLWGLGIQSPEEIAKICNISLAAAKIRAERMAVLYQRQKFLTSPLERQVYEQFKDFIAENKQK